MCDAANNVSRLTRDFNDVRKKFTDIMIILQFKITYMMANHKPVHAAAANHDAAFKAHREQFDMFVREFTKAKLY